jgi:ATP synthase protein I
MTEAAPHHPEECRCDECRSAELERSVRERRARSDRWKREGERSLAQNLAMIGSLGWLIVLPTLLGIFFGRWLDERLATGIFWTGALLVCGLALGCKMAWERMHQE